jgi:plastocyanin domain-containing protein
MQLIGILLIIIIIVLYLLWILYTIKQRPIKARNSGGLQIFDITVKGVYSPSRLKAKVGQPVRINFTRQESTDCSRFVNFPDFKIRKELPEGKTVAIEFTPDKKGSFIFTCDMSMYFGKLIIE